MNGFISAVVECVFLILILFTMNTCFHKDTQKWKKKKIVIVLATVSFCLESGGFLAGDWLENHKMLWCKGVILP